MVAWILGQANADGDTNMARALGWVVVYIPAVCFFVVVLIFAKRRNRDVRQRLERIENKLDQLAAKKS